MIGDEIEIKRKFGVYSIRYALACYALDDNPQHLWTVWRVCRKTGIEVPAVVLEYLDRVADALDPKADSQRNGERIEARVRAAVLGDIKAPKANETMEHARIVQRALQMSPDLQLNESQRNELAELAGVEDERTIRRWLSKARTIIDE